MKIADRPRRILIVDDEQVITDTLVKIFCLQGYQARGVADAEQALLLMEDWRADLLIIDVVLPGINGIDLAIRIKSQWPACHLLLFSGQGAKTDLFDALTPPERRFEVRQKPIPPSELLEMAARLFRQGS